MFKNSSKNKRSYKKDFFTKEKTVKKVSDIIYNLITTIIYNKIDHIQVGNLSEIKSFPEKNNILNIITTKNNSIVDFGLLFKNIDELVVITSTINLRSIEKLKFIKNKYLVNRDDTVKKQQEIYQECLRSFKKVVVNSNHAKILLIKKGDNYFVIEGSGNASINARIEFYNIMNNKDLYEDIIKCLKIKD